MTNFNLHNYEFDFFSEKKGLLANKTDVISIDSKSCNTFKKGSSLREKYEKNMSYPFIYKKM